MKLHSIYLQGLKFYNLKCKNKNKAAKRCSILLNTYPLIWHLYKLEFRIKNTAFMSYLP